MRLLPGAGVIADSYVGMSVGYELMSFDGGTSWNEAPARPGHMFGGIETYEDATHWWAIDGGILYKSSNSGQTWTQTSGLMANEDYSQYYITVIDSRHAWALTQMTGVNGLGVTGLALTNDGGVHWTRASVPQLA